MTIEKNAFREFVSGLPVGTGVAVRFTGGVLKNRSGATVCYADTTIPVTDGAFTFRGSKTGRGKGGSLLMRMERAAVPVDGSRQEVAFGTPELGSIVGFEMSNGGFLGYLSESDMPESRPPRPEYASRLKAICMTLIPLSAEHPARVTIRSSDARLNGTFSVIEARRHVGRHGQISLKLADASGGTTELWTYRHSGVVEHLDIAG
jgi:hypothetical protein